MLFFKTTFIIIFLVAHTIAFIHTEYRVSKQGCNTFALSIL
jgi:hypothetical protein